MTIGLVWAEAYGVIGKDGVLPWYLPEDLAHFKELTLGGAVVMGRKTWDSLPERFRPLPDRRNIVVTRQPAWHAEGVEVAHSLDEALGFAMDTPVWIIGGAEIFAAAIEVADLLEITHIDTAVEGDTHAPALTEDWMVAAADPADGWHASRTGLRYRFVRYARP